MGKEAVQNARARGGGEEEEEAKMRRRRTAMSVTDPCKLQSPIQAKRLQKKLKLASNGENIPPTPLPIPLVLTLQ
jgi:hypothetical protein